MRKGFLFSISLILLIGTFAYSLGGSEAFEYVGTSKCKMCHKSEKAGQQFTIWSESKHAKAFETLATPKAKEIAKGMGIEDPQTSDACLKCHATAAAVPADKRPAAVVLEDGVSCESCHGPGSAYKKKSIMEAIYSGEEDGAKYGLVTPDEKLCKSCHNEESPTYDKSKPFDFAKRSKEIAHPVPKAE
ncbi:MAG: cytochrome C554 [Candidatus Latescibacteria bacterium]|nr:cytochrome C554 [Candidatus Latescibacterota bacterium]NIM21409.1 cytochrome C554 [Candidatus Latescibacterota bacterium]NIM65590.1 cytochrome C554 [Candidatus Latescibacterota bacterium]NIO01970.1 cytochrome C554 [Candidatus Latescibacterota bacterium]NIO28783.1 cytochrome C554 [Candidatus Latescibacterota bacterium]